MPLLPPLVDAETLAAHLQEPSLRVFDTTVRLDRPPGGGPYAPQSGRGTYADARLPAAGFADLIVELADPDARFPFALPSAERFAAAAGRLGIGPGTHVVAYAQESSMWATRLWWLLRYFGFDAVSVLDGGLPAWRAAGLPTASGPWSYPATTFDARPRIELLATRGDVEAIVSGQPACLVNALSDSAFRGEGPTSYSRPGRIPGSRSVPSADLIDPATNRFRAPGELAARLDAVLPEPSVVAYCGGGISATIDVFALSLLGRDDIRLYDGSLTEWSADPSLPLEVTGG